MSKQRTQGNMQATVTAKVQDAIKDQGLVSHQDDPVISYAEAARHLGRHRSTIQRWAEDGLLVIYRHASGVPGVRMSQILQLLKAAKGTQ
jgi:hypothetical protein